MIFVLLGSGWAKRGGAVVVCGLVAGLGGCRYDYGSLGGYQSDASIAVAIGTGGTGLSPAPGGGGIGGGNGGTRGNGGSFPAPSPGSGGAGTGTGGVAATGETGGGVAGAGTAGVPGGSGAGGEGDDTGRGDGTGGVGSGGAATGDVGGGGVATGGAGAAVVGGAGGGGAGGQSGGGSVGGRGGAGTGAQPLVLSIDFVGGRWSPSGTMTLVPATAMTAAEVAGVKPAARWNSAPGSSGALAALALSSGALTAASVTWSVPALTSGPGEWTKGFTDAPGDVRMLNGYLDPLATTSPATVVVSGLPAAVTASGYDVYVYLTGEVRSATTRTAKYSIGATSYTATEAGPTATTFGGFSLVGASGAGNYVVFKNLTGASFTLTATPGTGQTPRAPVNGLQIVSPSGS